MQRHDDSVSAIIGFVLVGGLVAALLPLAIVGSGFLLAVAVAVLVVGVFALVGTEAAAAKLWHAVGRRTEASTTRATAGSTALTAAAPLSLAPRLKVTASIVGELGACPRGLRSGDHFVLQNGQGPDRRLCKPALAALGPAVADLALTPGDREATCRCPFAAGAPRLTFRVHSGPEPVTGRAA